MLLYIQAPHFNLFPRLKNKLLIIVTKAHPEKLASFASLIFRSLINELIRFVKILLDLLDSSFTCILMNLGFISTCDVTNIRASWESITQFLKLPLQRPVAVSIQSLAGAIIRNWSEYLLTSCCKIPKKKFEDQKLARYKAASLRANFMRLH